MTRNCFSTFCEDFFSGFTKRLKNVLYETETTPIWWLPVFVLPWVGLYFLVLLSYTSLPTPILIENELSDSNRFIAERAQILNREFTLIGEKVFGSYENEVLAVNFLKRQLDGIIAERNPIHDITYDVQKSSGSLQIDKATALYSDIQNFVVKFSPAGRTTNNSLLVNTHFDSVPISPGAGDDGIWVSVVLEVIRVLSKQNWTFENSIIFLFNGAEEVKLLGSHMFITQHEFAGSCKAFVNLDSCGTGGREVMFQSTRNNRWMMDYYKSVAMHPTASVLGDELFKGGLIPSDTDFRNFRDFGEIPGLDFAIYRNGYIYHTKYDTDNLIPMSTFQNSGDNMLNLIRAVADSSKLSIPTTDDDGELVFFDFLGWFMISYTATNGIIINVIVCAASCGIILLSMRGIRTKSYISRKLAAQELGKITIVQAVCVLVSLGLLLLLAVIYDAAHRSMSWFSNPWMLFGIYVCPMFFCLGIGPSMYILYRKKTTIHLIYYVQMFLHAQCILLILITLVLTGLGVRSSFILMFDIIFYSTSTLINVLSGLQHKDGVWIITHMLGQVIPFMFFSYYIIFSLDMFIPIQGRTDPSMNPDLIIAISLFGLTLMLGGLLIPTLNLFKHSTYIVSSFLVLFLAFIICMATPLGFPYKEAVSPQRFWIFHTERSFHKLPTATPASNDCLFEIVCGAPVFSTRMFSQSQSSYFVHAEKPNFPTETNLKLLRSEMIRERVKRFEFQVNAPDHMVLTISPLPGHEMIDWSLLDHVPTNIQMWNSYAGDRPTYFVQSAFGSASMNFSVDIQIAFEFDITDASFDAAVIGHYNHYREFETVEFKAFKESFPLYAHITPWISSYNSMVF
ncbi:Endoplasmic reticulum metallopeptidase 1 [Pseudolycoriella hygida]|uniref:FXNA-like protease n=1 Tax=Pseudolycoriella hygida TaxID=35572 RepID=A0A9Q0S5N6_9DIPT|nr:Endoplasmic reticulum metallopeptidase 1 [Pseudolycoriella hygida]